MCRPVAVARSHARPIRAMMAGVRIFPGATRRMIAEDRTRRRIRVLIVTLAVQGVAIAFFVGDVIWDFVELAAPRSAEHSLHAGLELLAVLSLVAASALTLAALRDLYRRLNAVQAALGAAQGAFATLLDAQFEDWHLTPAERDVALLSIKGLSIAEIAAIRATREGTVKAQLNAIYAKAGVSGRAQLLALFIELMLGEGAATAPGAVRTAAPA